MKNQASLRRKLNGVLVEHALAAAEKAIAGGDTSEEVKQLEMYEKLLAALPRSNLYEMYPAILIATACLLAASMAWTIRMPTTRVHLSVKTTAVSMRLSSAFAWQGRWPVGGSQIRLREFTKIELPPELGTSQQLTQRAWLDIEGGAIQLTSLDIGKGAFVELMRNESGEIDILTSDRPFHGQLDISGSPSIEAGSHQNSNIRLPKITFDPPATLAFYDAGRPANPSTVHVSPLAKLKFPRIPIYDLSLFTEATNARQEPFFASSITEGALTVSDSGTTVEFKPGDPLYLEGANGVLSGLEVRGDGLELMFDGEAHGVSLGTPGFERNLKPTILEYVYNRKKISFFWGAVTFLWGLIWSTRKLFSA